MVEAVSRTYSKEYLLQLLRVEPSGEAEALRGPRMSTVTNNLNEAWVNPLDPALIDFMRSSFQFEPVIHETHKPITTLSYEYYGTSSLWWLILYVNGFMHPDEIPAGTELRIPLEQDVRTLMTEKKQSLSGTVISV